MLLEIDLGANQLQNSLCKITILEEIQTLIVEYLIDQFLLTKCQKKRYEQGYDIHKEFASK